MVEINLSTQSPFRIIGTTDEQGNMQEIISPSSTNFSSPEIPNAGSGAEAPTLLVKADLDIEGDSLRFSFFTLSAAIKAECRHYRQFKMYGDLFSRTTQAEIWFTDGNHLPAWKTVIYCLWMLMGEEDIAKFTRDGTISFSPGVQIARK